MKHKRLNTNNKRPFPTTILLILTLLMMMAIGCTAGKNSELMTPSPDFQPLAEADLSNQSFNEEIMGEFTVKETAVTSLFYTLPNADTPYFDLSLIGPDDARHLILHSENYRTDENGGGSWKQSLTPGTYQLALTAEQSAGILSVYWGHH